MVSTMVCRTVFDSLALPLLLAAAVGLSATFIAANISMRTNTLEFFANKLITVATQGLTRLLLRKQEQSMAVHLSGYENRPFLLEGCLY